LIHIIVVCEGLESGLVSSCNQWPYN